MSNINTERKTAAQVSTTNEGSVSHHPLNGSLNFYARKKDMEGINNANKVRNSSYSFCSYSKC